MPGDEHKWTPLLKATIAKEYGEPERENEHCKVAAAEALGYLEYLGYSDETIEPGQAYELYLFAKHMHGRFGATSMGDCDATAIKDHVWS